MQDWSSLIPKCLSGDRRAEYALYKACFNMLMRICWRYTNNEDDAAALMNSGFLKILSNLEKYDQSKSFEAWAKTVMVRTIIDQYKSDIKRKETIHSVDMDELHPSFHPADINNAEGNLGIDEILTEIKKLPEPARTVFNLFVFDGLDHNEIGKEMGFPANTSKWHLSNARKFLQKRLAEVVSHTKISL